MLEQYSKTNKYLMGDTLVGDDFTIEQITQWYKEEEEAYCQLTKGEQKTYGYKKINNFYGLEKEVKSLLIKDKKEINIVREPISSMGNWDTIRVGTTPNERGLGIQYLNKIISQNKLTVKSKNYLLFAPFLRICNKLKFDLNSNIVVFMDYLLSKIFSFNIVYNRKSFFKKMAPSSIFFIFTK